MQKSREWQTKKSRIPRLASATKVQTVPTPWRFAHAHAHGFTLAAMQPGKHPDTHDSDVRRVSPRWPKNGRVLHLLSDERSNQPPCLRAWLSFVLNSRFVIVANSLTWSLTPALFTALVTVATLRDRSLHTRLHKNSQDQSLIELLFCEEPRLYFGEGYEVRSRQKWDESCSTTNRGQSTVRDGACV